MAEETFTWIDADGAEQPLDIDEGVDVEWGVIGRFMPPVDFIEEEVPLEDGVRVRRPKVRARDLVLPITVMGATEVELRTRIRTWLSRLNPTRGAGRLRVTAPDGSQRELHCYYADGMQGNESIDEAGLVWQRFAVMLRAGDPYWYDSSTVVVPFTTGEAATFFPIFPLRLSGSEVFAETTVDNTGDVKTWPIWTITGPGSGLVLRNLTTGKELSLSRELSAGETITIDTSPGVKTITLNDGTNLMGEMDDGWSLWPIERGSNSIRIELTGATEDSSVMLVYRRRYLGA